MTAARDVSSHTFSADDRLLVDTNVWLSVYGPVPYRRKRSDTYSEAIAAMKRAGSTVFIDITVLSEFVNHYARWEFRQTQNQFPNFKAFRDSGYFEPVAKQIAVAAMGILRTCTRCDSGLPEMDVSTVLSDFSKGTEDFNDQVITGICKSEGLLLITDDGDFNASGVEVLTANGALLNPN